MFCNRNLSFLLVDQASKRVVFATFACCTTASRQLLTTLHTLNTIPRLLRNNNIINGGSPYTTTTNYVNIADGKFSKGIGAGLQTTLECVLNTSLSQGDHTKLALANMHGPLPKSIFGFIFCKKVIPKIKGTLPESTWKVPE